MTDNDRLTALALVREIITGEHFEPDLIMSEIRTDHIRAAGVFEALTGIIMELEWGNL